MSGPYSLNTGLTEEITPEGSGRRREYKLYIHMEVTSIASDGRYECSTGLFIIRPCVHTATV